MIFSTNTFSISSQRTNAEAGALADSTSNAWTDAYAYAYTEANAYSHANAYEQVLPFGCLSRKRFEGMFASRLFLVSITETGDSVASKLSLLQPAYTLQGRCRCLSLLVDRYSKADS